ncbi:hypothetical protein [Chamaesiphon sp.]|uniref:hypothetical protein n=1 Tax=Chamaesiphon sp. TaxID=2814140 RepID=UPI0035935BBC
MSLSSHYYRTLAIAIFDIAVSKIYSASAGIGDRELVPIGRSTFIRAEGNILD